MPQDTGPSARLATGIPGLDTVLQGGFIRSGVYMVLGMPGAGKTIFANQLCFHHVAQGGKALYVTLLAETHARMMANLQSLRFFDPKHIPGNLTYLSAYSLLEEGGLDGLLTLIRKEVKSLGATLLVLDGLVAAEELAASNQAVKKFIHGLQVVTGMVGCTTLVLTTGGAKRLKAEHTMVDGLIVLRDRAFGARQLRQLVVPKFRGSGYLRGNHAFEIDDTGLIVYPRLESLVAATTSADRETDGQVGFGIEGLDEMLGGGVFHGSSTMVFGSSGAGKTLLGLSFLAEGARVGERGHYFAFYDTPKRALEQAKGVGIPLAEGVKKGLVTLSFRAPTENLLDGLGAELVQLIRERKIQRLFLDGFDGLEKSAVRRHRAPKFLAALVNECRGRGVALVYTAEARTIFGPELRFPVRGVSMVTENVLLMRTLELESRLERVISVLKLRNGAHDHTLRSFRITSKGIVVEGPFQSARRVLSGLAEPTLPEARAKVGKKRSLPRKK